MNESPSETPIHILLPQLLTEVNQDSLVLVRVLASAQYYLRSAFVVELSMEVDSLRERIAKLEVRSN